MQLLLRYGPSALSRLNGMFAFAFVDLTKRTFLLARDRLGVKPLYWCNQGGKLRFASELKGLLAWPDATRTINRKAVLEFLSLGYIPASSCILEGYGKLEAGTYAAGSLDRPSPQSHTLLVHRYLSGFQLGPPRDGPVVRVP